MIRAVGALALLACLAGPAAGEPAPAAGDAPRPAPGGQGPDAAGQAPLAVTIPDTQPALPSGRIEMDPSQVPSTGNADRLEPNIDGGSARIR